MGPEQMLLYQRMIMLQIVDTQWKDHLYSLDHLKEGIGLRGYGQRDPLVEYKKESFSMYQALMDRIDEESLRWIYLYQPVPVSTERPAEDGLRGPDGRPGRLADPGAAAREPRPPRPPASASPSWPWPGRGPAPQPELQRPVRGPLGLRQGRAPRGAGRAAARSRPCGARARRSAATTPAPAAAARNTRSAMARAEAESR